MRKSKTTAIRKHEAKGKVIRDIRDFCNYSRKDVARELKVSVQQVYSWESGRAPIPRKRIIALANMIKTNKSIDAISLISVAAMIDYKNELERYNQ